MLSHITRAVTATDSCFALIGSHHAACQSCWVNEHGRGEPASEKTHTAEVCGKQSIKPSSIKHMWELLAENRTAVLPRHAREGGSRVTSKSKGHTYTNPRPGHYLRRARSHITRVVAAMDTCGTRGKPVYFFFVSRRAYMAECNAKSPI